MISTFSKIIIKVKNKILIKWKERKFGGIGKRSKIIHPLRIKGKNNIYMGDDCFFLYGARIETLSHSKGQGRLIIGNNTSFQQFCHIVAADMLVIGNDCVFSSFVYVSDCSHPYSPHIDIAKGELDIKTTSIGNHCFVGIGACVMPGVNIGDFCVIGANAVVTHDVPSYSMVSGVPAKIIKRYNVKKDMWETV